MPGSSAAPARVNDFTIRFANVNGSGSASANSLILKAICRMGVPVVGKNFFPSNIQGLPAWYEIRVTRAGWRARGASVDLLVAMNAETYARDLADVAPGGWLVYDSSWPQELLHSRADVQALGVPLAELCTEHFEGGRTRTLMKNVMYAGVLAALVDLDPAVLRGLLDESFARQQRLRDTNVRALETGYQWARAHWSCPLPLRVERMEATRGQVLIDGNTAAALGCLYAGATVGAWYPITPSTSLMDAFRGFCAQYRVDPATGRHDYVILQAEDELAAIGIVIGAAWNGARAFTPTSGPGISLMQEFLGLAYYAEVPAVIFDVQRVGPSTGMPTRTQQCDLLACAWASHGDTRHVLLFPDSPAECFTMAVQAFDLAERLQTPVFVLSDLDIGMNDWLTPELTWDDGYRPDRGKLLSAEQVAALTTKFHRYLDPDGDGIPYRTLPGVSPKAAYFTRGSGHNRLGAYTEDSAEYQDVMDRLARKFRTAATLVPPALSDGQGASLGLVSFGSCDAPVREALAELRAGGLAIDYLRVRAFPFGTEVEEFLAAHAALFVVEQNRDAQLRSLLTLATAVDKRRLFSILHYDGLPMRARCIVDGVRAVLAEGVQA
ncbi:MAG: 2-oxoacid:acceptor oxidoreductase subunit alpha [Gammaproteobacteria bacterium]|nr:2-oxoacid:acceptor oxidoreductase subunit alpha [Gammaproteobacteria bacterium]